MDAFSVRSLRDLLPPPIAVHELLGEHKTVELFPEEAAAVARAVPGRRREYATVRGCARRALGDLGVSPVPIVASASEGSRAPRWPDGIVGSMTHCDGYHAAAVARVGAVASLGVDAEPNMGMEPGVTEMIALRHERDSIGRLGEIHPDVAWDRLVFSAKESVFKTWYPLQRQWLDFSECSVEFDASSGRFAATLSVPGPVVDGRRVQRFDGRWGLLRSGRDATHLVTCVVLPYQRPDPAEAFPVGAAEVDSLPGRKHHGGDGYRGLSVTGREEHP